jgi:hypothetical protein
MKFSECPGVSEIVARISRHHFNTATSLESREACQDATATLLDYHLPDNISRQVKQYPQWPRVLWRDDPGRMASWTKSLLTAPTARDHPGNIPAEFCELARHLIGIFRTTLRWKKKERYRQKAKRTEMMGRYAAAASLPLTTQPPVTEPEPPNSAYDALLQPYDENRKSLEIEAWISARSCCNTEKNPNRRAGLRKLAEQLMTEDVKQFLRTFIQTYGHVTEERKLDFLTEVFCDCRTQNEIAKDYGLSPASVSRQKSKASAKMLESFSQNVLKST